MSTGRQIRGRLRRLRVRCPRSSALKTIDRHKTDTTQRTRATCKIKNDASMMGGEKRKVAGHDATCNVAHLRTTQVARATQVARVTCIRHTAVMARAMASHKDESRKATARVGAWGLTTDDVGAVTRFVTPPRTLQDNLWNGPARKRKRGSSRSRSRSPKRGRWEDSLDFETHDWVEEMRLQATNLFMDNGAKEGKIRMLEDKVAYLYRLLAETRWELAENTGQTGGKNRFDFVEDEIDMMKNPPALAERIDDGLEDIYSEVDSEVEKRQTKAHRKAKQKEINAKDREAAANAPPIPYPTAPTFDSPVDSWPGLDDADNSRVYGSHHTAQATGAASPRGLQHNRTSSARASSTLCTNANVSGASRPAPDDAAQNRPCHGVRADGGQRGYKKTTQEAEPKPAKKRKQNKAAQSLRDVHIEGMFVPSMSGVEGMSSSDDEIGYAVYAVNAAEEDERAVQRPGFIALSLDEVLEKLPKPRERSLLRLREDLWQLTEGGCVPLPLGKFGQPFIKGWRWGEIQPRRVFKDSYTGEKLARDGGDFRRLAHEAVRLPFSCRSVTQRVVVAWAHRDGILPLPGWRSEPDVLHECRSNPDHVNYTVRQQNTVSDFPPRIMTQWDLIDPDLNLQLRLAKPENPSRKQCKDSPWWGWVWDAVHYGAQHMNDFADVGEYEKGPRAYTGNGDAAELFLHLHRCSLALERMVSKTGNLEDSDLGAFLVRHRRITHQQHELWLELEKESIAVKVDLRTERAYLSAHTTVDPVPPNRPIVRTFTAMRPKADLPVVNVDGRQVIDVVAIPDAPAKVIDIEVNCEHRWKANAARDAGNALYQTVIQVPDHGVEGGFLASEHTEQALVDLKLDGMPLERLRAFDRRGIGYLFAFPGPKDNPNDKIFVRRLHYDKYRSISFCVDLGDHEIPRHVLRTAAEVYRDEDRDLKGLRAIKVLLEAIHYPEGYCKGRETRVQHDCYLRRRRWQREDCMFTLKDINDRILEKLGLDDVDFARMDDGSAREGGIDEETLLRAEPFESRFDDHELRLVIRVHGSDFNPLKREGYVSYAESWDLTEEEMATELNATKRRKTDGDELLK
ncbi:hypothetical protein AURDEDRAFT_172253 [Auricularia subglabra TFB-10046 SS5]|nr:hypothetical protein AURDEDRAFT_172253 [Auricularia subglabra TFB-10046 SS5]